MSNVRAITTARSAPAFNPANLPRTTDAVMVGKTYRAKLTADTVDALPLAPAGVYVVKDTNRPGLELRVTKAARTFYCRVRMGNREDGNNRAKPVRLGTVEEAKGFANMWTLYADVYGDVRGKGRDYNAENHAARAEFKRTTETPAAYWDRYKERTAAHGRGKLRPATVRNYAYALPALLGDYWTRPMDALTGDVLSDLFVAARDRVGLVTARTGLRTVRAMQNYFELPNTTGKAFKKNADARKKGKRRIGRLSLENAPTMAAWLVEFKATQKPLSGKHSHADLMLLSMLTGLRNLTIRNIRWNWLDLDHANIVVPGEWMKNGEAVELPLSAKVVELLKARRAFVGDSSVYVFPAARDPRKCLAAKHDDFNKELPWHVSPHDGRKVMANILDNAEGVKHSTIKNLLTHAEGGDNDVTTAHYIEKNRRAMRVAINLVAAELFPA